MFDASRNPTTGLERGTVANLTLLLRYVQKRHYQELPDDLKRQVGSIPEGFLKYFTDPFPHLFLHVHSVIGESSFKYDSMFRTYFELVLPFISH